MPTDLQAKHLSERRWVEALLVSAQKRGWYGTFTVEIKNGMIHLVSTQQTLKPPTSPNS